MKTNSIFDEWIYDHAQYTAVLDTLTEEIERALSGSTPFVFPVLGDSRTGKTAMLRDIETRFSERVGPAGHCRVIRIEMPPLPSLEALAAEIIKKVMGPLTFKGKAYQVLNHAQEVMEAAGVCVLLVDEANHLEEKLSTARAQSKENRRAADWYKVLLDRFGISLVIAGLAHVSRIYSDNDQLENRGLVGARIYPYAWSKPADRVEYQNTLSAGMAHMKDNGWVIDVAPDLVTRVAYFGGGGYVGMARDFLVRIEKVGEAHKRLDAKLLERAYKDKYKFALDAFSAPIPLKYIDDVMLNAAHQRALERAIRSGRGR